MGDFKNTGTVSHGRQSVLVAAACHGRLGVLRNATLKQLKGRFGTSDNTLAHHAAAWGHLEILQYLESRVRGILEQLNSENQSVVYFAAKAPKDSGLECLVYLATRVPHLFGISDKFVSLPLCAAIISNNLCCAELIVTQAPSSIHLVSKIKKATLAHHAILCGAAMQSLEFLASKYPKMFSCITTERETPLLLAVVWNRADAVEFIASIAPDTMTMPDKDGNTPFHTALNMKHMDCLRALLMKNPSAACIENNQCSCVFDYGSFYTDVDNVELVMTVAPHLFTKENLLICARARIEASRSLDLFANYLPQLFFENIRIHSMYTVSVAQMLMYQSHRPYGIPCVTLAEERLCVWAIGALLTHPASDVANPNAIVDTDTDPSSSEQIPSRSPNDLDPSFGSDDEKFANPCCLPILMLDIIRQHTSVCFVKYSKSRYGANDSLILYSPPPCSTIRSARRV
jgi:ankyrin repeat protein